MHLPLHTEVEDLEDQDQDRQLTLELNLLAKYDSSKFYLANCVQFILQKGGGGGFSPYGGGGGLSGSSANAAASSQSFNQVCFIFYLSE